MARGFRLVKTNVRLPLKHDMFSCRFVAKFLLLVRGNLC